MLTLIQSFTDNFNGAALPVLVYCSAASVLAVTATFAPSRRRREAALRALRALVGKSDDDSGASRR